VRTQRNYYTKRLGNNIKPLLIGTVNKLEKWLGIEMRRDDVVTFAKYCKSVDIDPLGERGEYYTSSHKPVTQR